MPGTYKVGDTLETPDGEVTIQHIEEFDHDVFYSTKDKGFVKHVPVNHEGKMRCYFYTDEDGKWSFFREFTNEQPSLGPPPMETLELALNIVRKQ